MTPFVLIPGMMCDARLFAPQIEAFSADRPIHLAPIGGAETIEAIAAGVLEQAPPRFALAGLSMGGIIAMQIMAMAPERVDRLALLDTNPWPDLPETSANRDRQIALVRQGQLVAVMRDEMKPNYLADGPERGRILDLCMDMALSLGDDVFVRQSSALKIRPDQCKNLEAVRVPTLVMCGAEDTLCPLDRHEEINRRIQGSRLLQIEGAGHLPTLEQPDATNAALREWLES
ncbi:MAG: alpha/beta hydrolase [Alphaproteobacteria bacterium]|nr:alpha/beta hydrolase [Alphaproteobacteria bacterium]